MVKIDMLQRVLEKADLDTPSMIIYLDKMERNIRDMAEFAKEAGIHLRPHVKTHKCIEIAWKQIEAGSRGICVQKLGEAEVMAEGGIKDIFITNQVVTESKIRRLIDVAKKAKVAVAVDSSENGRLLSTLASKAGVEIGVFVEIDCGLGRCGVLPGDPALSLAQKLVKLDALRFRGILAFEGHIYWAPTYEERIEMIRKSIEPVIETADMIRRAGIDVETVSAGTTPSAKITGKIPGVNEIQPGNYIFYDLMQVERNVVPLDWCAQRVVATVISRPSIDRVVVDAGIKAFSHDQKKFPLAYGVDGARLVAFTEEHGVVKLEDTSLDFKIGDKIEFIPAHACTATNMYDQLYGVRGDRVEVVWNIEARGKMS